MSKYKSCQEACIKLNISCPNQDCRNWMDYEEDSNCVMIAIDKFKDNNKEFTLRDVSERLGYSFVRIKQIEETALKKINKLKVINRDDFI